MQIFHYHPETKIYLGKGVADPDPLVADHWLIPASATPVEVLPEKEGFQRVFVADAWGYEANQPIVEPDADTAQGNG